LLQSAESPSKSRLLAAQKEARAVSRKAAREAQAVVANAERSFDTAKALCESRYKRLAAAERRKLPVKKPSPIGQLLKASQAQLDMKEAVIKLLQAHLRARDADARVDAAQIALRDAKIVRLQRQLRVAKRAKRARRGWSTTRVRFEIPE